MGSLLDIAASFETVTVKGVPIKVGGVSASGLVMLMRRFPQIADVMSGNSIDPKAFLDMGGDIVAAIICAGTNSLSQAEEDIARGLPIGAQIDLLESIIRQTLPEGEDPLGVRLDRLAKSLRIVNEQERQSVSGSAADALASFVEAHTNSQTPLNS